MKRYPNIDAECARLGLSRERFAELLGVSRKTVYNWTTKGDIPQGKLLQMTLLLERSADYLLGLTKEGAHTNE